MTMRAVPALVAVLALLGCQSPPAPPSFAAASGGQDQGGGAAADMAALYGRICLDSFPDEPATQAALAASGARQLDAGVTATMLHADPGRAWDVRSPIADYRVTIEDPPFRTCAVRRMTREGLPTALPYLGAVNAYARQHSLGEGRVVQLNQRLPRSGADVQLLSTPLGLPGQTRPTEASLYISTNYHGAVSGSAWGVEDAAGGVGVEIRMAHQILPPGA